MRPYKWRTAPSGTEGTSTVYVDSYTGSDVFGDGTRNNPYKTLTKAFNAKTTKPGTIVCRGQFSEDLTGNHSCAINGDYFGAAIFDGLDQYMLYGFGHSNLIIKNIPPLVSPASPLLAGVGRALNANNVGLADRVDGLAGSSALLARCTSYMGVLGCTSGAANKYIAFVSPRCEPSANKISIAGSGSNVISNTYYNCRIQNRQKHYGAVMNFSICLFSDFDMIANDAGNDKFDNCLFDADCHWYYLVGNNVTAGNYYELQITGTTSAERQASLLAALEAKYDELGVAESSRKRPVFTNCIFSTQTASELFTAPEMDNVTLKAGCDADVFVSSLLGDAQYIGALPPSMDIPIMDDSEGVPETWDEHSASGCVVVDDNRICIDTESESALGELLSKVIVINPLTTQLNGVFAQFSSRFANLGAIANKDSIFGEQPNEYAAGDLLPVGRYIVTNEVTYGEEHIAGWETLVVSQTGTSFTSEFEGTKAIEIVEPNVMEVLYCRCRGAVYARVGVNDDLQAKATYLNDSGFPVTYHGRTIEDGESFVCMIDGEHFGAENSDATIAVMFDDTRVPVVDWCPAQLFGEYFVAKFAGAIRKDEYGIPLSTGNYMTYQTQGLLKSTMDRKYVQFAVKVNRYDTGND